MTPLDIIQKFLISDRCSWMSKVFLHQGFWSVAANNSCFLAFKGEIGEKIENSPLMVTLQQPRPKKALKLDLDGVKEWVSQIDPDILDSHTVPNCAMGVITGVNIDLRKLSFILSILPDEDLFVWNSTRAQGVKSIGFECGQWRGCLAGLASDAEECLNIFKPSPAKSTYDLMMELESE
jgi:hypothetical protein